LRGFCSLLSAESSSLSFRHHAQKRLEENGAENEIKNENDQGYRHSPKEQFAKLVNQRSHSVL
jgi:hypothetical protein